MGRRSRNQRPPPFKFERELRRLGPRPATWLSIDEHRFELCQGDWPAIKQAARERAATIAAWNDAHQALLDRKATEDQFNMAERLKRTMPDGYAAVATAQEAHSPTAKYEIRGDVRVNQKTGLPEPQILGISRRRAVDSELFMELTSAQQNAAEDFRTAYTTCTAGLGMKTARYGEYVDPGRTGAAGSDQLMKVGDWRSVMAKRDLDAPAVVEVLVFNFSCSTVDRARTKRNGWCSLQVKGGLDAWLDLSTSRVAH